MDAALADAEEALDRTAALDDDDERSRLGAGSGASFESGSGVDAPLLGAISSRGGAISRVTATQKALIPPSPTELDRDASVFAPLDWRASETYTFLEWARYGAIRYGLEAGLVAVFAAGASTRDALHGGYLVLALSLLRLRDAILVRRDGLFKYLRYYNIFAIGVALVNRAPVDVALGDAFAPTSPACGASRILGGAGWTSETKTALGFGAGRLAADLIIFVVCYAVRALLESRAHADVVVMEREARAGARAGAAARRARWLETQLEQCLDAMREREERKRRAEEVRAQVAKLSREVLELENREGPSGGGIGEAIREWEAENTADEEATATATADRAAVSRASEEATATATADRAAISRASEEATAKATADRAAVSRASSEREDPRTSSSEDEVSALARRTTALLATWISDRSSMLGLVFGALLRFAPWLAAPGYSLCYFLFFLAFAVDFSLVTLVYPTSLACYALIASPKPGLTYWLVMLVYSEACLVVGYFASVPCAAGCADWSICRDGDARAVGFPGAASEGSYLRSSAAIFAVYVAVLLHRFDLLRRGEGVSDRGAADAEKRGEGVGTGAPAASRSATRRRNRSDVSRDAEDARARGVETDDATHDSLSARVSAAFRAAYDRFDAFFQRALTAEAECAPSFVAVSVAKPVPGATFSDGEGGVAWREVEAALNVALAAYRRDETGTGTGGDGDGDGDGDAVSLELVNPDPPAEALPGGVAGKRDATRRSAVFFVNASPRALTPGADAARALEATQLRAAAGEAATETPGIVAVMPFHRSGRDYYFLTVAADMAALVFVTLFYQFTVNADPEALVETYHQGLFPIDYVLAVTACIALIVLDRVVYLNRAKAAKAVYHFVTYAAFCTFLFRLYHHQGSLRTTDAGRDGLLRVFFMLKSMSFALNARQIRSGYRQEGAGANRLPGRSDFITFLGFQVYLSVPFMYELRVLLDYACTDSSLDLFDWLKLENINRDLFRINVRNMTYRRYHPFGHPQPWWKKVIVQGGGLFLLLLSILLVPFFIFSTSNPQVGVNPVYSASLNLTVATNDSTAVYPIFSGGYRAAIRVPDEWRALGVNASAPPVNYEAQIQQVCVAPDSDKTWTLPPPPSARSTTPSSARDPPSPRDGRSTVASRSITRCSSPRDAPRDWTRSKPPTSQTRSEEARRR